MISVYKKERLQLKKKLIGRCLIICCFVVPAICIAIHGSYCLSSKKTKTENIFSCSKNDFVVVQEFLENTDFDYISIDNAYDEMYVGYNKTIDDASVVTSITKIIKTYNFHKIEKDNNTILFSKRSLLRDFYYGIAYPINNNDEPYVLFLTRMEPLPEDNWYYFESDYEEWRLNK